MNYANIKYVDVANGPGCRTSLFVSGCRHHCPGCFNAVAWDFEYGEPFTEEVQEEIISSLEPAYVKGLTVLGGEPMEPENQEALLPFLEKVRARLPKKSIWIFSGWTLEELRDEGNARCHTAFTESILGLTDVLVDGRFEEDKRNLSLLFRGSENQRLIDLAKTRAAGEVVLWDAGRG